MAVFWSYREAYVSSLRKLEDVQGVLSSSELLNLEHD